MGTAVPQVVDAAPPYQNTKSGRLERSGPLNGSAQEPKRVEQVFPGRCARALSVSGHSDDLHHAVSDMVAAAAANHRQRAFLRGPSQTPQLPHACWTCDPLSGRLLQPAKVRARTRSRNGETRAIPAPTEPSARTPFSQRQSHAPAPPVEVKAHRPSRPR